MEKFDDVIWAMEYIYYSIREQADKNFDKFLHAVTVVGDIDYEILSITKIPEVLVHSEVVFVLSNDEGESMTFKAEISNYKGVCKINYIEATEVLDEDY